MLQLLRTEWLKIKNYTAFVVIGAFFVIGVPAVNYIAYLFKKNVVDAADQLGILSTSSFFGFPKVWLTISYFSGWLLLLPALLLLILLTNEFTYRTNRQNIIDGWSREQFLHVKVVMALIFAVASTVMVVLTALIFGFATGSSFSLSGFENVGLFLFKAFSYNMIAIVIGLLVRRTGFAIAVFFIYTVLENAIALWLYSWAVKLKKDNGVDMGDMGNYLPMNASDGLLYSPFEAITKMARGLPVDRFWLVFCCAVFYLLLFYWVSRNRIVKSDL